MDLEWKYICTCTLLSGKAPADYQGKYKLELPAGVTTCKTTARYLFHSALSEIVSVVAGCICWNASENGTGLLQNYAHWKALPGKSWVLVMLCGH